MNVLCVSLLDNGQQLQNLAEALRRYTKHDALHISAQQSYLDYDADVKLPEITDYKIFRELIDEVENCDFFVFSEVFPSDIKSVLDRLHVYNKINPSNMIIRTAGAISRSRSNKYLTSWIKNNTVFAGPVYDWTLYKLIGRIAPVDYICPIDKMPEPNPPNGGIKICFSPTKKEKGVDEFGWAINKLASEFGDEISHVMISGKSWRESVETKALCNLTFDQFLTPSYANSAIESMYLNHAVLSKLNNWVFSTCPDLPIVNIQTRQALYDKVKRVIENPEIIDALGKEGHEYVMKHHTPEHVAKQWDKLIDHVANQ